MSKKPTNQKLQLPDTPKPIPYSETQEALAKAWERKEKMLGKISAGHYSGLQCRGMNAAVNAWRPPVTDNRVRSIPFTGRGGVA